MTRKVWIGGNFKAAANNSIVTSQVDVLNKAGTFPSNVEVVIAPSALHISTVKSNIRPDVGIAIQDVHTSKSLGAYTGSHVIEQVKDFGLNWVLVGHSERRTIWNETDEQSAEKAHMTIDAGMNAIFCIGETLPEREDNKTMEILFRQMKALTSILPIEGYEKLVIAYEPVWAIGTGKVATPEQAQEVHAGLRAWLKENVNEHVANTIRIVYGGSVNKANAVTLIEQTDIDGFLVGGASLKPEFVDIISSASSKK